MTVSINGASPKQAPVNVAHIPLPNGIKLVLTAIGPAGSFYVGSVTLELGIPPEQALPALRDALAQLVAQQTGGIQVAGAGAIAGLKPP